MNKQFQRRLDTHHRDVFSHVIIMDITDLWECYMQICDNVKAAGKS